MSITIAVIASDLEYITRLLSYMKASPIYHTWRFQLYTNAERLQPVTELERVELILVEEKLLSSFLARIDACGGQLDEQGYISKQGNVPMAVLVTERRELKSGELYKFQSASSLLHQLQQRYERGKSSYGKRALMPQEQPRTVAICSTLEQCGKTMMALHTAAVLASKGYRVFYCNFELWNTSELLMPQLKSQGSASYSDLLYAVKSNATQAAAWLADNVLIEPTSRLHTLRAFQHEADRSMLSAEDAKELLRVIASSNLYDYVIVDMPAGLDSWTLPVLTECDMHYMLMLPQPIWQLKHHMALAQAEQQFSEWLAEISNKRWYVLNDPYGSCSNESSNPIHEQLPYVKAWQEREPLLLDSISYRAAIERCVQHLMIIGEKAG